LAIFSFFIRATAIYFILATSNFAKEFLQLF
jgi:hypothetical protein